MIELKGQTVKDRFLEYASLCIEGKFIADEKFDLILQTFEANKTGILLCGNPGSGKTMLFEIIQKITHPQDERHFRIKSCISTVTDFNNQGHVIFRNNFFERNILWDDLGLEDKGKHYGETIEVMHKMLFEAYEKFKTNGLRIHFTTMMLPEEIEARYGAWFWSRLQQMCTVIPIKHNNDYRLLKNFKSFPKVKHMIKKSKEDVEWDEYYKKTLLKMQNSKTPEVKTLGQIMKEKYGTK